MSQLPLLTDFSSGEISPKFLGRADLPLYRKGCQTLENFMILRSGGVTFRGGTQRVADCYGNTNKARIIPFVVSASESYIIEMTAGYLRVFRNGNYKTYSASPGWDATTLWEVQYSQDHNGIYFTHADWAPVALIRTTTDNFTFGNINYEYYAGAELTSHATSNDTGNDTLVVTTSIASINKQGFLRVKHATGQYDDYTFTSWAGTTFTGIAPILVRDYDDNDTVIVGHAYHSNDAVIPFNSTFNYPSALSIAGGRFWFAGSDRDRQRIWSTTVFGNTVDSGSLYLDMRMQNIVVTKREEQTPSSEWATADEPETEEVKYTKAQITDDIGIQLDLGSDMNDAINWMTQGHDIHVGTQFAEWILPDDITARSPFAHLQTRTGSSDDVSPKFVWDILMFLQSSNKQVRAYKYSMEEGAYKPPDFTLTADHILGTGATQFDFQREPRSLVYFVRADGEMAVLTYEPDAQIVGWQRWTHAFGTFISVAVVPESGVDVVYAVVKIGSNYYLEKFADPFPAAQNNIIFMDSTYDATTDSETLWVGDTLTCDWMANQTVTLVIDGAVDSTQTASGAGAIDMTGKSGTQIYVGVAYTGKLDTTPVLKAVKEGQGQMQKGRIAKVHLRVYKTLQAKVAYETWTAASAEAHTFGATWETDDIAIPFPGESDESASVRVICDVPLPCTILSMVPEVA